MSREEDFESKKHLTKHLTIGRAGVLEEATRVNSWPELDWLSWKLYLARTLTPEMVTPGGLKTIREASNKYAKAYGSFSFGVKHKIKASWKYILPIVAVVGIVMALYFMGYIGGGAR